MQLTFKESQKILPLLFHKCFLTWNLHFIDRFSQFGIKLQSHATHQYLTESYQIDLF